VVGDGRRRRRACIDILYEASPRELEAISATFCALVGRKGTPRMMPCASTERPSGSGLDVRQESTCMHRYA